jgi:fibronectin type 3 domain-containing protein
MSFPVFCKSWRFLALALPLFSRQVQAQTVAVTTAHNDNARTGLNASETSLNVSNVNVARFGKLFSRSVDSKIWCQPLYVPNVAVSGKGTHNVVYVVSENGTVYAFDADSAAQSAPLWTASILASNAVKGRTDQNVSSPVIDPASNTLYLTAKSGENGWAFRIFALDIRSGAQKTGSGAVMSAVVAGNAKGSVNGKLTFNADTQKQRPALLLQGGKIYAAFGGSVDEFDPYVAWNGWIFVYDAATLRKEQVLAVAPNGNGGGIWQAGNGLSVDSTGSVYAITGNGNGFGNNGTGELYSFSASTGGFDYGNSLIKLSVGTASGTRPGSIDYGGKRLNITDYWTPYNWKYIETADQDLGSSGVLQIPGTPYAVTGDKIGRLYVLDTRNLGKFQASSNSQIVNDFQAWKGNLHGGMVYYAGTKYGPLVYGWSENDVLKSFKVVDLTQRGAAIKPAMTSTVTAPPGMPGGFLSISSNGSQTGSAVLWAYTPYEGDANQFIVPGVLHAFDASDLSHELWNSKILSSRDDTGLYSKFSNPTVVNGKVYVSSFSNQLNVYGLLPSVATPPAPLALKAAAGIQRVALSWSSNASATSYTLKRATSPSGPFVPVADNIVATTYDDSAVVAGTTYYYVVSASNAGGEGSDSAVASATPFNPANGSVLSVDFNGSSNYFGPVTSMAATEVAGVVAVANWNVVKGNSGSASNLVTNGGGTSGASLSWSSEGSVSTVIPDTAGNNRMMKGYLSNDSATPIPIKVQNLPAAFTQNGYDVYIYSDGVNPTASRSAKFSIDNQTLQSTDAENRDFEGRFFEPGVANVGNTVILKNLKAASFTLQVTQGESDDTTPRDPINGFQIVAHATVAATPSPTRLNGVASFNQVNLDWIGVSAASSYTVKRATEPNGAYTALATTTSPTYLDLSARNGVTYYYVVTATANNLESAPSNKATATPQTGYAGRSINIDFGGVTTAAQATKDAAGYVLRPNWNSVAGITGSKSGLVDEKGVATSAALSWQASSAGDLPITDAAGDARLMRGYIAGNQTAATAKITALPSDFLSNGYDTYVYTDSNNLAARAARYAMTVYSVTANDPAGTNFGGNYLLGNNASGNMLIFTGRKESSFTLSATALTTADGTYAAPINGLQIVARNAAAVGGSLPSTLSVSPSALTTVYGTPTNLNTVYADANGALNIGYAYLRIGTGIDDTAPLDVYYNGAEHKLYLYDGSKWIGGFTPGSNNVIKGPRGSLDCSKTVVTRLNSVVTISWNLIPSQALVGKKSILCRVQDVNNQWEQWKTMGSWTITAPTTALKAGMTSPSAPAS